MSCLGSMINEREVRWHENPNTESPDEELPYCGGCNRANMIRPDTTFARNTSSRYVGFELEFLAPRGPALSGRGQMKGDGSVGGQSDDPKDMPKQSFEFAAARARGDALLEQIEEVTKITSKTKANVNRTCGFHVHLDMSDEDSTKRHRIMFWWRTFEPVIMSMVSPTRRTNQYCKMVKDLDDYRWRSDRYCNLNLTAYEKFRTFEVRVHHGTLNRRKITNWIMFLLKFMDSMSTHPVSTTEELERARAIRKADHRNLIIALWRMTNLPLSLRKDMLKRIKIHSKKETIIKYPISKEAKVVLNRRVDRHEAAAVRSR